MALSPNSGAVDRGMVLAREPRAQPPGKRYVAIAGNIGSGKSSLTKVLCDYYKWQAVYVSVDDNPYLVDFYNDMRRWAFNLQVYFLCSRMRHQRAIVDAPHSVIQDRSIYEDVEVFARNLYEMSLMSERDYNNYSALFNIVTAQLRPPHLLIYLRASVPTLVAHIQSRGRAYESTIRVQYLQRLNALYEDWINRYTLSPKMIVDVDRLDFVHVSEDLREIIAQMDGRLFGLFPDI